MTLDPGRRLGPYEVLALLGAGGMGEVYRARDTRLDRTVALKVIAPALCEDSEARARFEREARAVSMLSHPHICALFDVGHESGMDFLVMEYLEGEPLNLRLQRGPMRVEQALQRGMERRHLLHHRRGSRDPFRRRARPLGARLRARRGPLRLRHSPRRALIHERAPLTRARAIPTFL